MYFYQITHIYDIFVGWATLHLLLIAKIRFSFTHPTMLIFYNYIYKTFLKASNNNKTFSGREL